jgi:hypothetical protein
LWRAAGAVRHDGTSRSSPRLRDAPWGWSIPLMARRCVRNRSEDLLVARATSKPNSFHELPFPIATKLAGATWNLWLNGATATRWGTAVSRGQAGSRRQREQRFSVTGDRACPAHAHHVVRFPVGDDCRYAAVATPCEHRANTCTSSRVIPGHLRRGCSHRKPRVCWEMHARTDSTCVCCSITSETRIAYGSVVLRQGRSRPFWLNHASRSSSIADSLRRRLAADRSPALSRNCEPALRWNPSFATVRRPALSILVRSGRICADRNIFCHRTATSSVILVPRWTFRSRRVPS